MHAIRATLMAAGAIVFAARAFAEVPLPSPRPGALSGAAAQVRTPLPPPRPDLRATASISRMKPLPARPVQAGDIPLPEGTEAPCTDLIASGIAEVELTASVSGLSGGELCGDVAPVRLTAVRLQDGGRVELRPAVLARCELAHIFSRWVREGAAAASRLAGGGLERIEIAASYSCRPRNNVKGARVSEHGMGNAIDIGAFEFADGRRVAIGTESAPAVFLAELRRSACARFTTVLGPGADAAHATHLHVDLARRRGGWRLCQWNMPDWPLP